VLSFASAPETIVTLTPTNAGNTRFSRNESQTSGTTETMNVAVQSFFGLKKGVATTDQYDDASLREVVRSAEELARLAPDDKETMPVLPPQKYLESRMYSADIDQISAAWRAKVAAEAIDGSRQKNMVAAGFLSHNTIANVIANSKGL